MSEVAANTRDRILDVAQSLIQTRGVNAMSFRDLSEAVGIRKASVHHHFPSKADMVRALLDRYQQGFQREVDRLLGGDAPAAARLRDYFDLFLHTLQQGDHDHVCLCGMLAAEIASLD